MFGSTVLEVAIGLALVFWFLSALSSALHEALAGMFSLRSGTLKLGIDRLLGSAELSRRLHDNPLIKTLAKKERGYPSYIPAKTFALALLDEVARNNAPVAPAAPPPAELGLGVAGFVAPASVPVRSPGLTAFVATLPESSPLRVLLNDPAITDLEGARDAVCRWFDDGMDRASGWYRRTARLLIALVAVALTVGMNVDAIRVGESLARDTTLRAAIVAASESAAKLPASADPEAPLTRAVAIERELQQLRLPIGWKGRTEPWHHSIPGWLITALAVSLGAPFWFDLLNKLVNLRNSGRRPEKCGVPPQGTSQGG